MTDNKIYVYVDTFSKNQIIDSVYPPERDDEIKGCSNAKTRLEKFCVWKLLQFGLKNSLGYNVEDLQFYKSDNGKWFCDKCYFSLSHSKNAVAVAISSVPVGIDIQLITPPKRFIENKILNSEELSEFNLLKQSEITEYLILKWCEKESLFKAEGENNFLTYAKLPSTFKTQTSKIILNDLPYALSVAAKNVDDIKYVIQKSDL